MDLAFFMIWYVALAPHELVEERALLVHRPAASWARSRLHTDRASRSCEASGHYLSRRRARGDVARGGRLRLGFLNAGEHCSIASVAAVLVAAVRGNNWQLAEVPQGPEAGRPSRAAKLAASVA